jgi:hypothetical protein
MEQREKRPYVDTPHWNVGFGTDAWFQRTFGSKWSQRGAKLIAVVVVVSLLSFGLGVGIGKATAAPVPSGASVPAGADADGAARRPAAAPAQRCVDMQQEPCRRSAARWAARKFRHGRMGHANHRTAWFFEHPHRAKRTIRRMIKRRIARARARGTASRSLRSVGYYTRKVWHGSTCDGQGSYSPYSYGFDLCEYAGPSPLTTKEQLQTAGSLFLCGTGVALGWWAGAGAVVVSVGASSCGWNMWLGMDSARDRVAA